MRRISFRLTQEQVLDRSKTVTRRLGWKALKHGARLHGVDRVMGWRKGEKANPKTLCFVEVLSVRQEPLDAITADDVIREGFPDMTPAAFVEFFCTSQKCKPDTIVTRIQFRYLDPTEVEGPQELDRKCAARLFELLQEGEEAQACELAVSADAQLAQLHPGQVPAKIWQRANEIRFQQADLFGGEAQAEPPPVAAPQIVWDFDTKRPPPWWVSPGCLWCGTDLGEPFGSRTRWTCRDACRSRVSDHRQRYALLVDWVLSLLAGEPVPDRPFYHRGGEGVLRELVAEAQQRVISEAKKHTVRVSDTFCCPVLVGEDACRWCLTDLPPQARGRRRRFCEQGAHRSAASRAVRRWRALVLACVEQIMGLPAELRAPVPRGQHVARGLLLHTVRRRRAVLLSTQKARLLPGPG